MQVIDILTAPYRKYERAVRNMERLNNILSRPGFGNGKNRIRYTIKVYYSTTEQLMVAIDHHKETKHLLN